MSSHQFNVWIELEQATLDEDGHQDDWEDASMSLPFGSVATFNDEQAAIRFAEWLYAIGESATVDN